MGRLPPGWPPLSGDRLTETKGSRRTHGRNARPLWGAGPRGPSPLAISSKKNPAPHRTNGRNARTAPKPLLGQELFLPRGSGAEIDRKDESREHVRSSRDDRRAEGMILVQRRGQLMAILARLLCVLLCISLCLAAGLALGAIWAEGSRLSESPDTYAPKLLVFVCGAVGALAGLFGGLKLAGLVIGAPPKD